VRQAAKGDIGEARELVQIQRLDLQVAPAFELPKDIGHGAALIRQGTKIDQLRLGVLEDYSDGFGAGVAGGPYYRNAYHIFVLIRK
jgi:hypothetical protein